MKHWEAGIQTIRYLKGTKEIGLRIRQASNDNQLEAYSDFDWATCPFSRRSVSGCMVIWNNTVLSWRTKKQGSISLSSTKAEYKALSDCTKEILWIKIFIKHVLKQEYTKTVNINADNQGAIVLAKNEANHSNFKTKHMEIKYHFIRQEVKKKIISLKYIHTNCNLADFLTKSVSRPFIRHAQETITSIVCSKLSSTLR